jgi:hypothetical protein
MKRSLLIPALSLLFFVTACERPSADDDCDGSLPADESDADGDGVATCEGDCDDANNTINPSATEVCNGLDDDCDGTIDDGFDSDGDGFTTCAGDCDDSNGAINPDAPEVCDGVDQDCDGAIDEGFDVDGDGVTTCAGDCDDSDVLVFPGQTEACNGIDDSCDGSLAADEADEDADGEMACSGDCDDHDPLIFSGLPDCPIDGGARASCREIRDSDLPVRSGVHTIDPAGNGTVIAVYCDQVTLGGGWMLVVNLVDDGWSFLAESETAGTPSFGSNYSLDISASEIVVAERMVRWGTDLLFTDAGATTRKFDAAHGAFRFGLTQVEASNLGAAAGCRHYYIAESSTGCYQLSDGNCFDVAMAGREREGWGWCNSGWNGPLAMFIRE